ncbi:hypothetical protein [Burkholderia sp. MSMB1589WGS]|uniref:hypothetical protein n=1 Tax=Burkholderia sp. MSMB1589WGS TaxID=1636425 RepID=UPI0018D4B796|nr:hypothetical protein [Burkholderia sp. MSMB1589WGS]
MTQILGNWKKAAKLTSAFIIDRRPQFNWRSIFPRFDLSIRTGFVLYRKNVFSWCIALHKKISRDDRYSPAARLPNLRKRKARSDIGCRFRIAVAIPSKISPSTRGARPAATGAAAHRGTELACRAMLTRADDIGRPAGARDAERRARSGTVRRRLFRFIGIGVRPWPS